MNAQDVVRHGNDRKGETRLSQATSEDFLRQGTPENMFIFETSGF